jgi:adenine-specific DNA-methyltransferase
MAAIPFVEGTLVDLLEICTQSAKRHVESSRECDRKAAGQVFTPPEVARFMASLLTEFPNRFRLLDPGAGVGILTAAVCERFLRLRNPRTLEAHLFESDPALANPLADNMERCRQELTAAGHKFDFTIHGEDFISAAAHRIDPQQRLASETVLEPFDWEFDAAILNPPYFKIRKDSEHARLMDRVVHGQPNAYAFFLALATQVLRESGELIAITPRSFCNGPYFNGFRRWLLERAAIEHVHLFESRKDAFREANILQESVVTLFRRGQSRAQSVTITSSFGKDDLASVNTIEVPTDVVVCETHAGPLLRIPVSADDLRVIETVESLPSTFSDVGLRISTGPVVMFRAREHLLFDPNEGGGAPLLQPHNVRAFETTWPVEKNGKPVAFRQNEASSRFLVPTRNYVLLRRFSAKEERRRLTASCIFADQWRDEFLGLENHLNYIYHARRELTSDETLGIAALLNSSLFDAYFRTISGNTQVNAAEIRDLPFPFLHSVAALGTHLANGEAPSSESLDALVADAIRSMSPESKPTRKKLVSATT